MTKEPELRNSMRKRALLDALEKTYGIVSTACRMIGVARITHYDWMKEDESYREAVEELNNVALDHSESKLHQLIEGVWVTKEGDDGEPAIYQKEPNVAAVIFHLKSRGKKRGYIEKEAEKPADTERLQPPNCTFISVDMSNNDITTKH